MRASKLMLVGIGSYALFLIRMDLTEVSQQVLFESTTESAQMTSEWIMYNFRVDSAETLIRNHFPLLWNFHAIYVRFNYDRLKCQDFCNTREREKKKFVFNCTLTVSHIYHREVV